MLNLIFPFIIAIASYIAGTFCIECRPDLAKYKWGIFSFTTGIALSYVLIILIPKIYTKGISVAFFVLLGFSFFLLIHAYFKTTQLRKTHASFSFFYAFVLGIVLVRMTTESFYDGLLLFTPILFMTVVSKLSAHHVHHLGPYTKNKNAWSYSIALAPVAGAWVALAVPINDTLLTALTGIIGGVILFTVIRELLPDAKHLNVVWFAIGEVLFLALLVLPALL